MKILSPILSSSEPRIDANTKKCCSPYHYICKHKVTTIFVIAKGVIEKSSFVKNVGCQKKEVLSKAMEGEKKLTEAVQNLAITENLQGIVEEQLILATDGKVQSLYLKKSDKHANGYGVKEVAWKREFPKVGMVAFAKIPSGALVIGNFWSEYQ